MYSGVGRIKYGPGLKAIVEVDAEICKYYLALIPKYLEVNPQAHKPHITVVREFKECPTILDNWGKYEGDLVDFSYSGIIQFTNPYYFINVSSERIGKIREELGLQKYRPPFKSYHITIGNTKK